MPASATTSRPAGRRRGSAPATQRLAGSRRADPQLALHMLGVERPERHAGLDQRDGQRVVEQVRPSATRRGSAGRRAAASIGVRLDVGVEADLAEEDAVGPGHGAAAHGDRLRAPEAVGELAQPLAHLGRAAARPSRPRAATSRRSSGYSARTSSATQPGRGSTLGRSSAGRPPAARPRAGDERAHAGARAARREAQRRSSHDSRPGVGERDRRAHRHAVEVGDQPVAVIAHREAPAAARGCRSRSLSRSPRIATAATCTPRHAGPRDALEQVELRSQLAPRAARKASTTGPRSASWQTLSTFGPADLARRPVPAARPRPGAWRRWRRR